MTKHQRTKIKELFRSEVNAFTGHVEQLHTDILLERLLDIVEKNYKPQPKSKQEWWEKMDPLPQYVKMKPHMQRNYIVYKEGVDFRYSGIGGHITFIYNGRDSGGLLLDYAKPATEADYIKYKNKKKDT